LPLTRVPSPRMLLCSNTNTITWRQSGFTYWKSGAFATGCPQPCSALPTWDEDKLPAASHQLPAPDIRLATAPEILAVPLELWSYVVSPRSSAGDGWLVAECFSPVLLDQFHTHFQRHVAIVEHLQQDAHALGPG